MVKYANYAITFSEVPDEVSLCFNITNCLQRCPNCHSTYLQEDIGTDLKEKIQEIINNHKEQFTCVCFLGEGNDHAQLQQIIDYVKKQGYKTCVYSGRDNANLTDYNNLDYYKTGSYKKDKGPLTKTTTNQKMYKKIQNYTWSDITFRFWPKEL